MGLMDIFAKVSLIDNSDAFIYLFKLEKGMNGFIWVSRFQFTKTPLTYKITRSIAEVHSVNGTFFMTTFKDGDFDVISV